MVLSTHIRKLYFKLVLWLALIITSGIYHVHIPGMYGTYIPHFLHLIKTLMKHYDSSLSAAIVCLPSLLSSLALRAN